MTSVDDMRMDLAEMEKLLGEAERQRVRSILTVEISKLRTQMSQLLEKQQPKVTASNVGSQQSNTVRLELKSITNYAWDQSNKFMKIYVNLSGVQNLPAESIESQFTESSMKVFVNALNNANHQCQILHLFENIIPEKCYHKVKTDCVLVMLKKKEERTWAYVTKREAKALDKKPMPSLDKDADPNASMMQLMQKMYEDGDDEMKRTIAKSMYESRMKSTMDMN